MDETLGNFVATRGPAITVGGNESAESVLCKLGFYDITSVPVVNNAGSVIGVVSVLDILGYISFQSLDAVNLSIAIEDILRTSSENKDGGVFLFEATEVVSSLLKPFSLAVHRVLVRIVDQHQEIDKKGLRFVSQTDLLKYLNTLSEKPWLSVKDKSLQELNIVNTEHVVSCSSSVTAHEAFKILNSAQKPAICILDENGKVVANLSASDLRGVNARKLQKINLPVLEFLAFLHGKVPTPLTAKPGDSLDSAIGQCVDHHVHRLWVVDDSGKLTGVVTLTDFFVAISAAYGK